MLHLLSLIGRFATILILTLMISSSSFSQSVPETAKEFGDLLDRFIVKKMSKHHIAGSVLIYIKNGKLFYKKGYGFANLELKTPVDPDKTVFRVGSISKLFIGTAVMQLVEQGKLDLNEDINTYLTRFKVPTKPSKPVKLKHLLTHTAGFDDLVLNRSTLNREDRMNLGKFLQKALPDLVMKSGQVISYSNYGMNLAAYIVELVSGKPFHQCVDNNILKPLNMHQSSFMPLAKLMNNKATPYVYRKGRFEPLPHDYPHDYASGSLMTTATDMAKFMIAHLKNGNYNGIRILKSRTAEFMHQQQFSNFPTFPGVAISFFECFFKGKRILWHTGGITGFQTKLTLIPDHQSGIFMSYNADIPQGEDFDLNEQVCMRILDQYYPSVSKPSIKAASFSSIPETIEGRYRNNRLTRKQLTKIAVIANDIEVKILDNNSILVGKDRYERIDKLLFEMEDDTKQIAFRTDEHGKVTKLFKKRSASRAWDRLSFFDSGFFHQMLLLFSQIIFLLSAVLAPFMIYRQCKQRKAVSNHTIVTWSLAGIVGVLNITAIIAIIWIIMNSVFISFKWTLPAGLEEILIIPIITAILGLALLGLTIQFWLKKRGAFFERIFFTVIILGCLMFSYFLSFWNLFGF